jgi:hypothetical protein
MGLHDICVLLISIPGFGTSSEIMHFPDHVIVETVLGFSCITLFHNNFLCFEFIPAYQFPLRFLYFSVISALDFEYILT